MHRSTRKSERGQATAAGIEPGRGKKLREELSCLTPRQSGARQPRCFCHHKSCSQELGLAVYEEADGSGNWNKCFTFRLLV